MKIHAVMAIISQITNPHNQNFQQTIMQEIHFFRKNVLLTI